jgi:hypothetical protein
LSCSAGDKQLRAGFLRGSSAAFCTDVGHYAAWAYFCVLDMPPVGPEGGRHRSSNASNSHAGCSIAYVASRCVCLRLSW